MSQFTERTHAAEFTKLVSAQSSTRTRRAVARAQERIGVNAEIVKSLPTLDEWLARRPH
jgi:hypothetical protein